MKRLSRRDTTRQGCTGPRGSPGRWDRSLARRQFRSGGQRHSIRGNRVRRGGRVPKLGSARSEVRGATPDARCGVAKRGADGPARRSSWMSRGMVDGATANSSPQTAAGHHRMTRPSRRSSSLGAACGFWIRAWGQREPALQGTGRLNRSAQGLGWLKGGLDIPATHAECGSLQREHPIRSLTRRARSRAGRVGNVRVASHRSLLYKDVLPVVPWPIEQDPGHRAVPVRDGRPFSRSPNSVINTKGRAFRRLTTISNDLRAALVDEPMAQLHECAPPLLRLRSSGYRPG